MNKFWRAAPWMTRLLLAPPAVVFTLIGIRNLSHLTEASAVRGIVFTSGLGLTIGHVGFGAFPLGCAIFLVGCLFSERRLLTALAFVGTLDSVVLIVRLLSMYADASVQENLGLVRAEVFLLVLVAAGLILEFARRRRASTAQLQKA